MGGTIIKNGVLAAEVLGFGAVLKSLKLCGTELVIGYGGEEEYRLGDCYFGATVGRTCNRTGKVNYIDGRAYELPLNERGVNHLHGGFGGLSRKCWTVDESDESSVKLSCFSPDGEDGYPGNLNASVQYILKGNALVVRHTASTDAPTWVSMTNHSYFNLGGVGTGDVFGTKFRISASDVSIYDENARVVGRASAAERLGIDPTDENILDRDFDHNFYIKKDGEKRELLGRELCFAAEATGKYARMKVWTDLPCVQFYTGAFIPEGTVTADGSTVGKSGGFCFETQYEPGFQSRGENILRPGGKYDRMTVYEFEKI